MLDPFLIVTFDCKSSLNKGIIDESLIASNPSLKKYNDSSNQFVFIEMFMKTTAYVITYPKEKTIKPFF
jgi:hypothetical protein